MPIFLCTKDDSILISQCGDEFLCRIDELPEECEIQFCYSHKEAGEILWKSWLNYGAKIEETNLTELRKIGGLFKEAANMAERLAAYEREKPQGVMPRG